MDYWLSVLVATAKLIAARELRYRWFERLLEESRHSPEPLRYILTAHHSNDNAETILMNLFRETGLAGLKGILPARNFIRRPLLFADRNAILDYARAIDLHWVEDSSNESEKYARNYIRHTVIPAVEVQYPALVSNLNDAANRFVAINEFYEDAMASLLRKIVEHKGAEQRIAVLRWRKLPGAAAIMHAWIQQFGFSSAQVREAVLLAGSQTGHYMDSATHRMLKNRQWLVMTPLENNLSAMIMISEPAGETVFREGVIRWQTVVNSGKPIPAEKEVAWLDADKIVYPLLLRPWKAGDYFYPMGMQKKKKIARFLIDTRIARHEKEKVWVVESDKKILWVVGQRIDDRFRVMPGTKSILSLQVSTLP